MGASLKNYSCCLKEQSRAGPSVSKRTNCLQAWNKILPHSHHEFLVNNDQASICIIIKNIFLKKKIIKIQWKSQNMSLPIIFVWLTIVFVWLSATIDYFKNNYLEYFFHKNHEFSIQKEIKKKKNLAKPHSSTSKPITIKKY